GVVTPTTARDTPGQGPAGTPGGTVAVREEPYSTIDPALRTLIMLAEDHKESIGVFADSAQGGARDNLAGYLLALKDMPMAQQTQVTMLAMALQNVLPGDDHIFLRGALACKDRREGENVRQQVETALANIAKRDLRTLLGLEFKVGGAAEPETQGDFARSGPPALSGGGQAPQGGQPPARAGGGAGMGGFRLDDSSGRQAPPSGGGGFTLGGPPTVAGSPETPVATAPEHSTITVTRQDEIILVTVDVNRKAAKSDRFIESSFGWIMVERRAEFEIGAGQVRVADLAGGLLAYRQGQSVQGQNAIAPFGALPRRFESERGRPYPPSERVSFFADLMPYFSERMVGIREGIDPNKSWKDPDNVRFGRILVSELITPGGGRLYTRVSGVDAHLAVTQFVGMAGVGPDAPYSPANHPLAGVFGYDRQTRLEDIRDGASTTIMLIQVDGDTTGPWIAGGGATVRGTSPNCDRDVGVRGGFRSPNHGGKEGVWVVMADGSVRFLSRSISPNVFKALCTLAGGDDPGDIDLAAPRQKLETFNTRTARPGAPATPAAPPRPRVKEEDDH
ncbi:MAG TPA: DUF1559 domain-containing protein, partial [Gemmatales bacterium]|nr:DUF1559 domain-containing protein [Gemmatales bacterium]